jgi:lipid-A-disaccharide synthase
MEFYGEAAKAGLDVRVIDDEIYDLLRASDFAIVASGTATLEAAIIGTPMVIIYKVNLLTYIIAKLVSGFKYLGLVNIIHGDGVVPELLQYDATPKKIAAVALQTLKDETKKRTMLEGLRTVREALGAPGASERAAKSVLEVLNR